MENASATTPSYVNFNYYYESCHVNYRIEKFTSTVKYKARSRSQNKKSNQGNKQQWLTSQSQWCTGEKHLTNHFRVYSFQSRLFEQLKHRFQIQFAFKLVQERRILLAERIASESCHFFCHKSERRKDNTMDPESPIETSEERSEQALGKSATSSKLDDEAPEGMENSGEEAGRTKFSEMWTNAILEIHKPIVSFLNTITQLAVRNPWRTISMVAFLSFALLITGFATNFSVDVDENDLWTPNDSLVRDHARWIDDESKFTSVVRFVNVFFHEDGKNVLGRSQVNRVFEVVDAVQALPGYEELCSQDNYRDPYSTQERNTCEISYCVTKFYNNSYDFFQSQDESDEQVIETLSQRRYPEGTPVPERSFGHPERDDDGTLTTAQSVFCRWTLPELDGHLEVEKEIIEYVLAKRSEWAEDEDGFRFRAEVATRRSFADEFERAIVKDIPLVPIVFLIMGTFTALFFARANAVYSRSLLGFLAVVSILFSIMSGFGLLFCIGISFTSMSQLLPFVIFGIGLDDAFIIFGAYGRTDPHDNVPDRIRAAINDIGVSITLTSIT